jgi:PAS domain S-box-containing protein
MGIRGKFVVSTIVLAVLIGAGPLLYVLHAQRSFIYSDFERRGLDRCRALAESLTLDDMGLASGDHLHQLRGALQEPELVNGYILDAQGRPLLNATGARLSSDARIASFDRIRDRVIRTGEPTVQRNGARLHFSAPLMANGNIQGFVHLDMSLRTADLLIYNTLERVAMVAGLSLILGLLCSFLIAQRFARPVLLMLSATKRITNGDYNVTVPVRSRDELGHLAAQINAEAASLRATTVSCNYVNEILQSMVDSLIVVDMKAVIVTANRAALDLLGYEESQLIGKPASLVCIDEGYQLTGQRLMHLLGDGDQQDYELTYRTSAGMLIPISFSGSPIHDHSGAVAGYVCIGKDITDRKRADLERAQLNQQLVETSRHAGMAEVATGVLHNVGNVLNSVNMSASMVSDTIKHSKIVGLMRAIDLINEHAGELADFFTANERGRQLPTYLDRLSKHLETEREAIATEIASLTKNIDHIREIIGAQQSHSKPDGLTESVNLSDLIDEALQFNATIFEQHHVQVQRKCARSVPAVEVDKHKLLQILVNLLANAGDAMAEAGGDKKLTVQILDDRDIGLVRIEIADNGVGIDQQHLTAIFTHGFTTKHDGHGFGLHSAALTARELGGDLCAHSDGPGTGATFTLSLPISSARVAA